MYVATQHKLFFLDHGLTTNLREEKYIFSLKIEPVSYPTGGGELGKFLPLNIRGFLNRNKKYCNSIIRKKSTEGKSIDLCSTEKIK